MLQLLGNLLHRVRLLPGLLVLPLLLATAAPPEARQTLEIATEESAEQALDRIEAYLNDLRSLRASFVQIAPNGGMSSGKLYYARPDKMRLDYDPPSELLIVANGWQLVYHDRRLEQVSHLFTRSTPLAFLLQEEVRLEGDVTVTGFERRGDEIGVALAQTEDPAQGQITLVFGEDPLELRRWTVTDAQGLTTHVILEELETDVPLDRSLFVWRNPNLYPELRRR
jgi:outer membrane lipoprotein-sorting protein